MADLIGHPDTYKPTPPGPAFFVLPLRESSWSRLCSAAASCRAASASGRCPRGLGSVPPTPSAPSLPMSTSSCFAELVSIGPLPLTWPRVATLAATRGHPPLSRHCCPRQSIAVCQSSDFLRRPADGPPPAGSEKLLGRCRRLNG